MSEKINCGMRIRHNSIMSDFECFLDTYPKSYRDINKSLCAMYDSYHNIEGFGKIVRDNTIHHQSHNIIKEYNKFVRKCNVGNTVIIPILYKKYCKDGFDDNHTISEIDFRELEIHFFKGFINKLEMVIVNLGKSVTDAYKNKYKIEANQRLINFITNKVIGEIFSDIVEYYDNNDVDKSVFFVPDTIPFYKLIK